MMKCIEKKEDKYVKSDKSLKILKKRVISAWIIAALMLITIILALINGRDVSGIDGSIIEIIADGVKVAELDYDTVSAMNSVEVKKTLRSGSRSDEEGVFTGVPLENVILYVYPSAADYADSVTVKATDGFTASYDKDELNDENNVILVYKKDGKALKSAKNGGSGPFRIIVMKDAFGNRSVKYLCRIEIKGK